MAAQRLGWKLLDHALTEEIATLAKVSPETCKQHEENDRFVGLPPGQGLLARQPRAQRRICRTADIVDAERLICLTQQVIERHAAEGQCVIVGRAAAYFLRERTDTFCVFLYAPRELKYQRVLARSQE